MELFIARNEEDKEWLDRQLDTLAKSPVDVEWLLKGQRAEYENAWGQFEAKRPREAKKIQVKLNVVGEAARNREAVRSELTRLARLIRQFLLPRCFQVSSLSASQTVG